MEPTIQPPSKPKAASQQSHGHLLPPCKACGGRAGEVCYGKFGYYLKCSACQTNTAIRFACQPGHNPRLRKAGLEFYRECAECGSSDLVHRNTGESVR